MHRVIREHRQSMRNLFATSPERNLERRELLTELMEAMLLDCKAAFRWRVQPDLSSCQLGLEEMRRR